jgi:hypothetical protein
MRRAAPSFAPLPAVGADPWIAMSPRPDRQPFRPPSRRPLVGAVRALALAVAVAASSPAPAEEPSAFPAVAPSPRLSLAAALAALQERGLPIVFTSEVVRPEMTVEGGSPTGDDPRQALDELLAPHGLTAVEGPRGVLVVVRAVPGGDCAVDGEVRDTVGRPLAGAAVELAAAGPSGAPIRSAEADAAGGIRFAGLPCGDYLLTARAA